MLSNLPKPAIIAHRGSSLYAPENTLAAFKLALEHGADGIELDVKLTADGQIAVLHDQTVDRTTPASGRVRRFLMAELHKMDAGSHFDIAFRGEPVPSLEDVFKAVGQLTYMNIELTNYSSPFDDLPDRVADLVKQYRISQRVFFSSFNIVALIKLRKVLPEATIGLLVPPGWRSGVTTTLLSKFVRYESLHMELRMASPELIHAAHQKACRIFFYTVNSEHEIRRLFEFGADGIFTDDPPLARGVLESMRPSLA